MCDRCGEPGFGSHDFRLASRPAHRLIGRFWEGSYGEGAREAVRALLSEMGKRAAGRGGLWVSPVIGISWNGKGGTFRYFAGIVDDSAPEGLETLDLPDMRFASSWHGPEDGDVLGHYARMTDWIAGQGFERASAVLAQREEYAPGAELAQPPELRIMLPVAG